MRQISYSAATDTIRKYIVDIAGKLPVILCEIDTSDSSLTRSYIYSDRSQIICQRDGDQTADEYFYVTDRLGSVRQVVDNAGSVVLDYTYSPFGQMLEQSKKSGYEYSFNNFLFTGQWYDFEFSQYYLRARMYDPYLGRFTSRDPVKGKFKHPLTLHKYLYCLNNPVNRIDPDGRFSLASILVANVMSSSLRMQKSKFDMDIFNRCKGKLDAFSLMNLQRGAMYDMFIADMDGDLGDVLKDSAISAIGLYSENLGRLASLGFELYGDRGALLNIFENESWGGLFDYSKDKFKDIILDPDNYM